MKAGRTFRARSSRKIRRASAFTLTVSNPSIR